MSLRAVIAVVALATALLLATDARAGGCPPVSPNAFAFINPGDDDCPPNPGVRWNDARSIFDCSFLADPARYAS